MLGDLGDLGDETRPEMSKNWMMGKFTGKPNPVGGDWNMFIHFLLSIQLGISSSQLTISYFSEG